MKLLTQEIKEKLPPLYATERNPQAKAIVKFFTPRSCWTWYAFEFDGEDTFFGFVEGFEKEWGYFNLSELESLNAGKLPAIERDLYYTPQTKVELDPRMAT